MKNLRVLIAGAVLAVSAPMAQAQTVVQCDPAVIVDLSERILRHRTEVGRFQVQRTGATAAYLLGHYGGLSEDDQLALLSHLREGERNVALQEAHEMALALAISRDGVDAGLRYFGGDPVEEASVADRHLQRAIIMADAGESYFRLINAAMADPEMAERVEQLELTLRLIAVSVIDQDDAFLLRFSENAEAAGDVFAAVPTAANMQDKSRLEDLMARYAEDPEIGWLTDPAGLNAMGAVWATQRASLDPNVAPEQAALFAVARADAMSGPMGFLAIATNFTGDVETTSIAAREFLAALEAGQVSPFADPEEVWLMQYRSLAREIGAEGARAMINQINWPPQTIRHFAELGHVTMDRIITYNALGPVLAGASFPPRPSLLGAEAPWEEYEPMVTAMARGEDVTPASLPEAVVMFELLWRAGDHAGAIALAEENFFEANHRIAVYRDVSRRMDGHCDGILAMRGQGLLFGGLPIYRYPAEPYRP